MNRMESIPLVFIWRHDDLQIDSQTGDEEMKYLSDALKSNTSLTELSIYCRQENAIITSSIYLTWVIIYE